MGSFDLLIGNLISPPILFFILGLLAVFFKSDLQIPQPIPKFLSMYLLMAIGLKGGQELAHSGLSIDVVKTLGACLVLSIIIPIFAYPILRSRLHSQDAAATAATYGSVSAVTFITALAMLDHYNVPYDGHMIAALALTESPAIIIGVILARLQKSKGKLSWENLSSIFKEAVFNGSVFLLLGSLLIGALTNEAGRESLKPFTEHIFKGALSFFLLDMGLLAASRIKDIKGKGFFLVGFAILFPIGCAVVAGITAYVLQLSPGNALLLIVLCASASYIAVPAAVRMAIPEANPGIFVPLSLGVTFPFNILIGLPIYFSIVQRIWGLS